MPGKDIAHIRPFSELIPEPRIDALCNSASGHMPFEARDVPFGVVPFV